MTKDQQHNQEIYEKIKGLLKQIKVTDNESECYLFGIVNAGLVNTHVLGDSTALSNLLINMSKQDDELEDVLLVAVEYIVDEGNNNFNLN